MFIITTFRMAHASTLLLCGGAQVVEDEVVTQDGRPQLKEVWRWRPEQSKEMPVPMMRKFITTDDCKAVSGGKEVLITSSGDAVALVSHVTGKTLFYATVKNAHSAEILPSGLIAVASSSAESNDGDRIVLFDRNRPDAPVATLPLSAAHGVVWDRKREVLWALGGKELLQVHVSGNATHPSLVVERRVPIPPGEGHDLQIAGDAALLYVTNSKAVFEVDPETLTFRRFQTFAGMKNIKSLSINPGSGQLVYTQADPGVWWTYTLHFMNPAQEIVLPSMIYKARWFLP
uniref:Uncharacterized protein n=2 Tax=Paracidobacterium acidisoli TaxID=2303751 RepID=A0A372IJD5_9BACT